MNDNNVEYTFGLNSTKDQGRSYELVIGAPLLDHNDVHWEIKGNSTAYGEDYTLCKGSFGFDDIKDMFSRPHQENPASKFTGNTAIATVSVGDGSANNKQRSIHVVDLFEDKLPPGASSGSTQLKAACPAASADKDVGDYHAFDACSDLIKLELTNGTVPYTGQRVDPDCATNVSELTALSSTGLTSTALAFAMDVGIKSLHLINPKRCNKTKIHDDESKAQDHVQIVMFVAILTITFSTVLGIYFVYQTIGHLCKSGEDSYLMMQSMKKDADRYFGIVTSIIGIVLVVVLYMSCDNLFGKMDIVEKDDDNCSYSFSSDFKSHKDVITGLFSVSVAMYGLSMFAYGWDKRHDSNSVA